MIFKDLNFHNRICWKILIDKPVTSAHHVQSIDPILLNRFALIKDLTVAHLYAWKLLDDITYYTILRSCKRSYIIINRIFSVVHWHIRHLYLLYFPHLTF
ncbi:hypothetical protein D3C81_1623870 [compost metagenome]